MDSMLHLVIDPSYFPSENIHVCGFALSADVLGAVRTMDAVRLLRANCAALHDLTAETNKWLV